MSALADALAVFARSDLAPGLDALWYRWATVTCTHVLVGIGLSLLSRRWALAALGALLVKELWADLPGSGWASLVMADSLADMAAYLAGLMAGHRMQGRRVLPAREAHTGAKARRIPRCGWGTGCHHRT
jgi:hypothetical protein